MKLAKTSSLYPKYLTSFFNDRPGLASESYHNQYKSLMSDCAFYADFWKQNLEANGTWTVQESVVNCESIQRQWARENGMADPGDQWRDLVLEEQITSFGPDVWFCHSSEVSAKLRERVRSRTPSLRYIFGYDGIGRNSADAFAGCDAVVCLLPESVVYYRNAGFEAIPRKLGFETRILRHLRSNSPKYPVSFVGGVHLGSEGHVARLELLLEVMRKLPISVFTAPLPEGMRLLRAIISTARRSPLDGFRIARSIPGISRLNRASQGAMYGLSMFQALKDSLVSLNCHIDVSGPTAANFRMFEATGVGSCLLTDYKPNIRELFEPDSEVVTYRSLAECLDRARYLIGHPTVASDIAKRGQARTLRDHTLAGSIAPVMDHIKGKF